jgi:NAD(P)-dependent dehydrogenase (short-subunit alcohol dehydrogenase family)
MSSHCFQTYAHSKLANILFTKTLAQQWASDGIRAYSVHPGFVRTNIVNRASDLYLVSMP